MRPRARPLLSSKSNGAERLLNEADFSAAQPPSQAGAWFLRADVDQERPACDRGAPAQGTQALNGLMRTFGSLRRRGEFSRLRRHGRRTLAGALTVYRADAASGPALVGISASRSVGGAVTRNRVRRRILSILDELARRGTLPKRLLIEARPQAAVAPFQQLRTELVRAIDQPA